jgi:hypothetical protein
MVQLRRIRVAVRLPGPEKPASAPRLAPDRVMPGSCGVVPGPRPGGTLGQVKDQTGGLTGQRPAQNAKMQEIGCRFACTLA